MNVFATRYKATSASAFAIFKLVQVMIYFRIDLNISSILLSL